MDNTTVPDSELLFNGFAEGALPCLGPQALLEPPVPASSKSNESDTEADGHA